MKKSLRIKLILITVILLAAAGIVAHLCINYFFYDEYKEYLSGYSYEEGKEFIPLEDGDPKAEGMVLVAENDILKLYTNTTTTEVAVFDKRSGEMIYSNPVDRANDPLANGRNKTDLNSQFMLTYYNAALKMINMYSYDYSVERNQFTMESIENGVRVIYLLGNMDSPTGLVPVYITEERLQEKILSKLTEKEAKSIKKNYLESTAVPGFLELTQGAQANKVGLEKINALVEKAGYTQADFDEDATAAAGGSQPERTTFTVPLEYRLSGDQLIVSIPTDHIIESGGGKIGNIDLLSYFGAAGTEKTGYLLVPNGSGSLIYFNNGKQAADRYNQYIYGMDELNQSFTVVEDTEKARLPVFGIKRENSAVFAEITGGDTLANIIAEVSGDTNSYNYVYSSFLIRGSEKVGMFGVDGVSADMPVLEKNMYDVNLAITYTFLNKEDASYSGMANYYRNELIKRGELTQKAEESDLPFYLDIVGGVKMQQSFAGVPYLSVYPMTTFEEAEEIVDVFIENNITNLRMNYLGWFNGGYYHNAPKKVKVERKLGGKKDLAALNQKLLELGGVLYGDVAFQKVSYEADNFNNKLENSQYYTGYPVIYGRVNPATLRQTSSFGYMESVYNVLSPRFLVRHVDKFTKGVGKVELTGISLRDLADTIASDKKRTNVINRQESKQIILRQFDKLKGTVENLMGSGGNAYSFAYMDDLINVPSSHNPFYLVDEEVPFYQMVIHGCIDYASGAINLTDSYNEQEIILRLIEFGSAPHFTFSYKESSDIKYSALNTMFSTQYETWIEDAVTIYEKTNEALEPVVNATIIEHTELQDQVKQITYDNGVVIYINYNQQEVTIGGITIPAMSYVAEGVRK